MNRSARTWRAGTVAVAAGSIVAASLAAVPATAAPNQNGCDNRSNNTYTKVLECVRLDEVVEHMEALQAIADANNGTRVSGSPGYDQSVDYAVEVFEAAGLDVTVQDFTFSTFITLSPTVLERVSPAPAGPIVTNVFSYSGSGAVTASVTSLPAAPADPTPGCEPGDFAGFPAGDIALISRGACSFAIKATNAANAGAAGVVIYNNSPGVLNGTLGSTFDLDIAVTSVTQEVGQELAATPDLVLRLQADTFRGEATTSNVLAETPWGDPDNVVMVGAHLDSVNAGPGINDNGSGTAAILETAQALTKTNGANKVRFALWGAEESGLVGSTYYVNELSDAELDKIALYLNFDMIGSPNYYFGVYDADESSFAAPVPVPDGSVAIEDTFESFYTLRGEPYDDSAFSGRSDYQAFINNGIASGGLFTGAEVIKTPEQEDIWGGTAGDQFDPCYHLACDTIDNYDAHALEVNSDAVAFAVLTYAYSTESVNGVKGKKIPGNFQVPAPAGPEYTFAGPLGGDDHDHDHDHGESE